MKSNLDVKLSSVYPRCLQKSSYSNGSLGIEVELEGNVGGIKPHEPYLWTAKNDGSLRNGVEYTLVAPTPLGDLPQIGKTFKDAISGYHPLTSIRTSMHIHVCVSNMTLREVYNAVFAYYMLEELLISEQPKERQGNLFCLRMSDTHGVASDLKYSLNTKKYFILFRQDTHKYGALNLAAICKYGSLEFRFMQATFNPAEIMKWAKALSELVINGSKYSPSELLKSYEDLHVFDFVSKLIPSGEWLVAGKSRGGVNNLIHTNYDAIVELNRAMILHDRFSLPRQLWNEDEDPTSVKTLIKQLRASSENVSEEEFDPSHVHFADIEHEDIEHDDQVEDENW